MVARWGLGDRENVLAGALRKWCRLVRCSASVFSYFCKKSRGIIGLPVKLDWMCDDATAKLQENVVVGLSIFVFC